MPDAASVFTGPAEIAFTRMFRGPELGRQVPHRRLERGLGDAHHVVIGEHALAAEVRQRQHAAAAALVHERRGPAS